MHVLIEIIIFVLFCLHEVCALKMLLFFWILKPSAIIWFVMLMTAKADNNEKNDGAILSSMMWCTPTKAMLSVSAQMFRMQRCRTSLDRFYAYQVDQWHALLLQAKIQSRQDYNHMNDKVKQESNRLLQSLYKIYLLRYWIDREMHELQKIDLFWPRDSNDIYEQQMVDASGVKRIMEFEPNGVNEDSTTGGEADSEDSEDFLAQKISANI